MKIKYKYETSALIHVAKMAHFHFLVSPSTLCALPRICLLWFKNHILNVQ